MDIYASISQHEKEQLILKHKKCFKDTVVFQFLTCIVISFLLYVVYSHTKLTPNIALGCVWLSFPLLILMHYLELLSEIKKILEE